MSSGNKTKKIPSKPYTVGNSRIAEKLLHPDLGLQAVLKDTYGVEIKEERQRSHTKNTDKATTTSIFSVIGSNAQDRHDAISLIRTCRDSILEKEQEAYNKTLRNPNKHSQRIEHFLLSEDVSALKGLIATSKGSLENTNTGSIKPRDAKDKVNTALNIRKTALDALYKNLDRLKGNNVKSKEIQGLLDTCLKSFTKTALPKEYSDKINAVKDIINNYAVELDEKINQFDENQSASHTAAKSAFSNEEQEELLKKINEKEYASLDDSQRRTLFHHVLKARLDASLSTKDLELFLARKNQDVSSVVSGPIAQNRLVEFKENSLLSGKIVPRNRSQQEQVIAMRNSMGVVAVGEAGTGKTLFAIAYALERYKQEKCRIVIATSLTELGDKKDLGALPGGELEKIASYSRPVFENLLECVGRGEIEKLLLNDKAGTSGDERKSIIDTILPDAPVQITPLALIRGRTFKNTTLIVDEAQNLTIHEAKAVLKRAGTNTKIIFCGDIGQTDLSLKDRYGNWKDDKHMPCLPLLLELAKTEASCITVVNHPSSHVERSPFAKDAAKMFEFLAENIEDLLPKAFENYPKGTQPFKRQA